MCSALTEPEAGSDAQAIRTSARRDGDTWVIDGHKHYITNADKADIAVVFAVTDAERRADGGIAAFCVPRDRYRGGKKQHTIAETHPARFSSTAPASQPITCSASPGRGFSPLCGSQRRPRLHRRPVSRPRRVLPRRGGRARQEPYGLRKPLARFQGVSFPVADSNTEIEAMRWRTYHLAWAVDQGEQPILDASIVKYYDTERSYVIADRCLQVFGGMGLLREGPIEHVLRYLRIMRIVEGASEVQKLFISRSLGL